MKNLWFTDGTVIVRPYSLEDVEQLFVAASESVSHMYRWLPWCHPGYNREEAKTWVDLTVKQREHREDFEFAIFDANNERLLGGCGLGHLMMGHRMANLGYWVRKSEIGKGIAGRACELLVQFGFRELHLHRIELVIDVDNIGSQKVAEKLGGIREGVLRKRIFHNGFNESSDAVMYSIVMGDRD